MDQIVSLDPMVLMVDGEQLTDEDLTDIDVMAHWVEDLVPATLPVHPPDPVPRMSDDRLTMRIRVLAAECPKKPGSVAARNWTRYVDGMMLSAYLGCPAVEGGRRRARRDVAWDLAKGHIALQTDEEWRSEQVADRDDTAGADGSVQIHETQTNGEE